MATKKKKRSRPKKKRVTQAAEPVAAAQSTALEWASDHRYELAAGAVGLAAVAYFWPRPAEAATLPAPAPVPAQPILTNQQIVEMQTEQQRQLGMKIGVGAFLVVAGLVVAYVATSEDKKTPVSPHTGRPMSAYEQQARYGGPLYGR